MFSPSFDAPPERCIVRVAESFRQSAKSLEARSRIQRIIPNTFPHKKLTHRSKARLAHQLDVACGAERWVIGAGYRPGQPRHETARTHQSFVPSVVEVRQR